MSAVLEKILICSLLVCCLGVKSLLFVEFTSEIDFIAKIHTAFCSHGIIFRAAKLIHDGPALKIYQQWLRYVMAQRISIIAVIDNDMEKPPIVAMQCLFVETKGDRLFYQYVSSHLSPY